MRNAFWLGDENNIYRVRFSSLCVQSYTSAKQEVDVAIGPFGVTLARIAVADFSVPITATDHAILYRRPQIEADLAGFVRPFALPVGVIAYSRVHINQCRKHKVEVQPKQKVRPQTCDILPTHRWGKFQ